MLNNRCRITNYQSVLSRSIFLQIRPGELEQGHRGARAPLLHMDKGPCQLNQPFIEIPFLTTPILEPKSLQDIVCLVELLAVEGFEKTKVMGIKSSAVQMADGLCDFGSFPAHGGSIAEIRRCAMVPLTKDGKP